MAEWLGLVGWHLLRNSSRFQEKRSISLSTNVLEAQMGVLALCPVSRAPRDGAKLRRNGVGTYGNLGIWCGHKQGVCYLLCMFVLTPQ